MRFVCARGHTSSAKVKYFTMPGRRKAVTRRHQEATDSDDEPKSKRACPAPKPRAKKSGPYKMPPPLPAGEVLTDITKHSWRLGESIGKGGFGEIYRAVSVGSTQAANHVIKIEPHENGPLYSEIAFYCRAAKEELIGKWVAEHKLTYLPVPKYITQGRHCHAGLSYRFLVMDCFGEDVEKKFNQCGRQFSIKTVCHLALRILEALQFLHESEYAHGDIKGSNLLTGQYPSHQHQVYLVDYGLACRYRPQQQHKEYKEDPRRKHDGTLEFTSIDAHKGVTPSARGDLEILAYCLLQWASGRLPWDQCVKDANKDAVAQMKIRYKSDVDGLMKTCFTAGRPPPTCLRDYMTYVHSLGYKETPDYTRAKQMFVKELSTHRLKDNGKNLDWMSSGSKRKARLIDEEIDSVAASPPKKQTKFGARVKQRAKAVPAEPESIDTGPSTAPVVKGKKRRKTPAIDSDIDTGPFKANMCASSSSGDGEPVTAASSSRVPAKGGRNTRGKKRKIGSVPVVGSINTAVRSDSSSGGGETSRDILFPKVSYPEELGYNNGSGLTLVEPPSKRTKVATGKKAKARSQVAKQTSTSPKRVTPTQSQSHRKTRRACGANKLTEEKSAKLKT